MKASFVVAALFLYGVAASPASTGSTGWTEPSAGSTEPSIGSTGWTEPSTGSTEPSTGSTGWTEPSTGSTEPSTGSTEPSTGSTGWTEPSTGSTEATTGTTENPAEVKKEIELLKQKIVAELFEIRRNFSQVAESVRFSVNYYNQKLAKDGDKAWKKISKNIESDCKKRRKDIKKLMDGAKGVDIRECLKVLSSSACSGESDLVAESRQCVSEKVTLSQQLTLEINDLIDGIYLNVSDSREQMGSCLAMKDDRQTLECLKTLAREVRALEIADVPEVLAQIKADGWIVAGMSIKECKMEDELEGLLIDLEIEVLRFHICVLMAAKPNPSTPNPPSTTPTWAPSSSTSEGTTEQPCTSTSEPSTSTTPTPTSEPSTSTTPTPTSEPSTSTTPTPTSEPSTSTTPTPTSEPPTSTTPTPTSEPSTSTTATPTSEPSTSTTSTPTLEPSTKSTPIPTSEPSTSTTPTPTSEPSTSTPKPTWEPTTPEEPWWEPAINVV